MSEKKKKIFFEMAQQFIDELHQCLKDDPCTSQWLLPLEPLLHHSYEHRFRIVDNISYFLVYDAGFEMKETWLTVCEFYHRSKMIAQEYFEKGYYDNIEIDAPTGN